MVPHVGDNKVTTGLLSNFCGPPAAIKMFETPVERILFGGGPGVGNVAIAAYFLSYAGNVSCISVLDSSILGHAGSKLLHEFNEYVKEEINLLNKVTPYVYSDTMAV